MSGEGARECPNCRMSLPADASFCPHFGYRLSNRAGVSSGLTGCLGVVALIVALGFGALGACLLVTSGGRTTGLEGATLYEGILLLTVASMAALVAWLLMLQAKRA